MNTLLLDNTLWDLLTDAAGNIAMASDPYSLAQDVASCIRLFKGELWFNTSPGVPYFEDILGHTPPLAVFRELMVEAALRVPGVVSATCVINNFQERTVTGQVHFTTANGNVGTVSI